MTPTRRGKFLGLAVGERVALVAEVSSPGGIGQATIHRVAEFTYANGADLAHPDALGQALGVFLREQGFTARSAVIGVPGKWVLSKRVEAPPAEPALVAESLRLQAEGEFGSDGGSFAYDYAGEASRTQSRNVLLMAVPQKQLDQVTVMADAARLKAVAVVPFAATLAAASTRGTKNAQMLLLGPGGAEFVSQNGGYPHVMRYLGPSGAPPNFLAGELRRATSAGGVKPISASGNGSPATSELTVWNDARLEQAALDAFGRTVGSSVRLGEAQALGVVATAASPAPPGYAAAVSLAMAGLEAGRRGEGALPVDFLHSRLAPPKQVRIQPRTLALAVGGTAALLLMGLAIHDIRSQRGDLEMIQAQVTSQADRVKDAEANVARMGYAQAWQDATPNVVACLNDLTSVMPEDGKTFLTSFNLNDELKGSFAGKTAGADDVLALRDRLESSGRFGDVHFQFDARRPPSAAGGAAQPGKGAPPGQPPAGQPPPGQPGAQPAQQLPRGPQQAAPGQPSPAQAAAQAAAVAQMEAVAMPRQNFSDTDIAMSGGERMVMSLPPGVVLPPGVMPPGGPGAPGGPQPAAKPQAAGPAPAQAPMGPPPGAGGADKPAAAAEVTFVMTFNYVPKKKQQ